VKQVPRFDEMSLGSDGRIQRTGVELEMNPYCRRAVAKGVELAFALGGKCTVFTLGPPPAEDVLREAVAWGADDAVLITDRVFAGSDTLATALTLAAALEVTGPWDLVLVGRNSVDADTGQVGPELAELLDLPFLSGVRELSIDDRVVHASCERDNGFMRATTRLPALLACAERLCEPAKVPADQRARVDPSQIRVLSADDLGAGPWGAAASPTSVGRVTVMESRRERRCAAGPVEMQVAAAVEVMRARGVLGTDTVSTPLRAERVPAARGRGERIVVAVLEPARARTARELLGAAAQLAASTDGHVVAITTEAPDARLLGAQGADEIVRLRDAATEEDAAAAFAAWCETAHPWAALAPSTVWGREVASRAAARLRAGLTGDAISVAIEDGRLVGWKPAFGGHIVAAITSESPIQMVTVRPGMLPVLEPRALDRVPDYAEIRVDPRGRVRIVDTKRDDEFDALVTAKAVIGVGSCITPDEYVELEPLLAVLDAELGATRKVTDKGWLPRSRQIGITGQSIQPSVYVAVGLSGKFNHMIGVRGAGVIVAINRDPAAEVFSACDAGIVADWRDAVPMLVDRLTQEAVLDRVDPVESADHTRTSPLTTRE
jgi:electron transfer flavoprotein alpha subunit